MEKKTKSKLEFFRSFFALTAKFKKWRILSKNKHHIRIKSMFQHDEVWIFQAIYGFFLEK